MVEENLWSIDVSWSNYFRDPFCPSEYGDYSKQNASIHDALPYAIGENTLYNEELADYLGIERLNRVIGENEDTLSWVDTEDWAISCSRNGHFIVGQTISCSGKGEIRDFGILKEEEQVRQFEHRIKPSIAYEYLDGVVIASLDQNPEDVEEFEKYLRSDLEEYGKASADVGLRKFEKEGGDWTEIFSNKQVFPENRINAD